MQYRMILTDIVGQRFRSDALSVDEFLGMEDVAEEIAQVMAETPNFQFETSGRHLIFPMSSILHVEVVEIPSE